MLKEISLETVLINKEMCFGNFHINVSFKNVKISQKISLGNSRILR